LVTVDVPVANRAAYANRLEASMFIRTREPNGLIFYVGTLPGQALFKDASHIVLEMRGGRLVALVQLDAQETRLVVEEGRRVDDGEFHLVKVSGKEKHSTERHLRDYNLMDIFRGLWTRR
jgi:protein crumbs